MTLDELLEKHPAPWKEPRSQYGITGGDNITFYPPHDCSPLLIQAVNRIHEMRGEMDELRKIVSDRNNLKTENAALKDKVNGYRDMERNYNEFVSDNLRLQAENERLKSNVGHLELCIDRLGESIVTSDESTAEIVKYRDELLTENAALKAMVSLLENTIHTWRRCDDDVREQRRFEAAVAIRAHDGCSAERAVEEAEELLAALDKPKATPEPKSLIDILHDEKEAMIERGKYPAAAMIRDFTQWMKDDCPTSFHWHALGLSKTFNPNIDSLHPDSFSRKPSDEPPEQPPAEVWRIEEPFKPAGYGNVTVRSSFGAFFSMTHVTRLFAERIVAALNGGER